MILRNRDHYRDLVRVGAGEMSIARVPESEVDAVQPNGFFWETDGRLFGLGVRAGEIVLVLGNQIVEATSALKVEVADAGDRRTFSAFDGGRLLSTVDYEAKEPYWNFFAMDHEDVDGFVWMNNVLASPERRAVFIGANT